MAITTYLYRWAGADSQLLNKDLPTAGTPSPATLGVLVPITIDDSGKADLDEAMAQRGYAFAGDLAGGAVPGFVRDYGALPAVPAVPAPSAGDRYFNTTSNNLLIHNGTSFVSATSLVTGFHRALRDPGNIEELTDKLDVVYRPSGDDGLVPATLYVDAAGGNDTTSDGSAGLPFATLGRAIQLCAECPTIVRTIQLLGTGPYVLPLVANLLNQLTILGDTPSVFTSRAITSVNASTRATGLVLTLDGAPFAVDALRGKLVTWTSGALAGQYGVIYKNTATDIYVSQDTTGVAFKVPAVTDTLDVLDLVTEISIPADRDVTASDRLTWDFLKFTGGAAGQAFVVSSDQVTFRRCSFSIGRLTSGGFGRIQLRTSYVANTGKGSENGMLAVRNQGHLFLRGGTVIDAVSAGVNDYVSATTQSSIEFDGEVVARDLGAKGFNLRGTQLVQDKISRGGDMTIRFRDCAGGLFLNGIDEGSNGWCDLPDLFGNITTGYAVQATRGVWARLGAASAVATPGVAGGTGTNDVSADGGASPSAQNSDLTYVEGGAPAAIGFATTSDRGSCVLLWGANAVAAGTTPRYLFPGFDNGQAQTTEIEIDLPYGGTLKNFTVRQRSGAGNGNPIVYAVRVNGVTTALSVTLASTPAGAVSDTSTTVAVSALDRVSIVVTKAAGVGTSPKDITATLELEAA